MLAPQSVSRHHCVIQLADNAAKNSAAVAVLKDSSFNGCFVGDDLVRNRAEWLAAGDMIRFGNDKEKFIVETITMNEHTNGNSNGGVGGTETKDSNNNNNNNNNNNSALSPIEERNQHGGMAAGMRSAPSEHIRQMHPHGMQGNSNTLEINNLNNNSPTRNSGEFGFLPPQHSPNLGRDPAPWANMAVPPRPTAPPATTSQGGGGGVTDARGGQSWTIDANMSKAEEASTSPTCRFLHKALASHQRAGRAKLRRRIGSSDASLQVSVHPPHQKRVGVTTM